MKERAFIDRFGKLIIPDAKILLGKFRNFSGKKTDYNREGYRNFNVLIEDSELAEELFDEGWNIKILAPRDESEEPKHFLPVAVSYKIRPPRILLHTKRNTTELDEESVGSLDYAEILSCDMVIRPNRWDLKNGNKGVKAYLESMHVTLEEDYFAEKYAEEEYPGETPFE